MDVYLLNFMKKTRLFIYKFFVYLFWRASNKLIWCNNVCVFFSFLAGSEWRWPLGWLLCWLCPGGHLSLQLKARQVWGGHLSPIRFAASYPRGLQELYNFIENFKFCLHENNEMHSKIIISTKTHKQKLLIYIYNSMLKNGPSNVICLRRSAYHLVNFCP